MKTDAIELVRKFNKSFGILINKKPEALSKLDYKLKFDLMMEELSEYMEACENEDIIEIADAVVDMQYILNGIILAHGLQHVFEDMFIEVHESNMSKLENGKVLKRKDGKVLKGKNYYKPNLKKYLK